MNKNKFLLLICMFTTIFGQEIHQVGADFLPFRMNIQPVVPLSERAKKALIAITKSAIPYAPTALYMLNKKLITDQFLPTDAIMASPMVSKSASSLAASHIIDSHFGLNPSCAGALCDIALASILENVGAPAMAGYAINSTSLGYIPAIARMGYDYFRNAQQAQVQAPNQEVTLTDPIYDNPEFPYYLTNYNDYLNNQ